MTALLSSFWSDPLWYIGLVFALLGALAFLTFMRGFLAGLPHLFTLSGHEEHLHHNRVHITWGLFSLIFLFTLWQLVKWVAGIFTI